MGFLGDSLDAKKGYLSDMAFFGCAGNPIQPEDHTLVIDDASQGFVPKHEDAKRNGDLSPRYS
jgi:hypothetical protein